MWSPQQYLDDSNILGISNSVAEASIHQIGAIRSQCNERPSILTLSHLAERANLDYYYLRSIIGRRIDPYRSFSISKRSGGRRTISVPEPPLMSLQRSISRYVLRTAHTHPLSFGFKLGSSIVQCAQRHCEAKWLIKFDVSDFFHNTSEISVYWAYRKLGYQPLVAFELARLSTRVFREDAQRYRKSRWTASAEYKKIGAYVDSRIGHLPQGAPTSPMLANLCCFRMDQRLSGIAKNLDLRFTRYSDDITFSSWKRRELKWKIDLLCEKVYSTLNEFGYSANKSKTKICAPGDRKIVLGLQVGGKEPKLSSEFKDHLRLHLYFCNHPQIGVIRHAIEVRGFDSVWGFKNYLRGLIDFSNMVDEQFAGEAIEKFEQIDWPI
jgi:RNA-directed DNA polymerase